VLFRLQKMFLEARSTFTPCLCSVQKSCPLVSPLGRNVDVCLVNHSIKFPNCSDGVVFFVFILLSHIWIVHGCSFCKDIMMSCLIILTLISNNIITVNEDRNIISKIITFTITRFRLRKVILPTVINYCYRHYNSSFLNRHDTMFIGRGCKKSWKNQRGNHNPYIEEEQKTQWPKEKVQTTNNDLQNIHIKLKIEQHEPR